MQILSTKISSRRGPHPRGSLCDSARLQHHLSPGDSKTYRDKVTKGLGENPSRNMVKNWEFSGTVNKSNQGD